MSVVICPSFPIAHAAENGVELLAPYDGPGERDHVVLVGKQGAQRFLVSKRAARLSLVVGAFVDEEDAPVVPLPEVPDEALRHIATWLQHHEGGVDDEPAIPKPVPGRVEDSISEWNMKFLYTHLIRGGDEKANAMLIDVTMGANFMNVSYLLDMCCAAIATIIRGKTTQQIRDVLDIENDFTPEEEDRIAMENRWCEEL